MPIVQFNKAINPAIPEDVHINTDSILFVEKCHDVQIGRTAIQVMGLGETPIRVIEPPGEVLARLPGLVAARRYYLAGGPSSDHAAVHIAVQNVSYLLPNVPQAPVFWTVHFKDASELCITDPLPLNL